MASLLPWPREMPGRQVRGSIAGAIRCPCLSLIRHPSTIIHPDRTPTVRAASRPAFAPSPRVAVSTYFVLTGFISASWIARIPAAANALDLSTASLGTLLLFVGVGSILAFQIVGRLIERFGSARVATGFGLVFSVSLSGLALAPVPIALGAALFVYGFTFGAFLTTNSGAGAVAPRASSSRPISSKLATLVRMLLSSDW